MVVDRATPTQEKLRWICEYKAVIADFEALKSDFEKLKKSDDHIQGFDVLKQRFVKVGFSRESEDGAFNSEWKNHISQLRSLDKYEFNLAGCNLNSIFQSNRRVLDDLLTQLNYLNLALEENPFKVMHRGKSYDDLHYNSFFHIRSCMRAASLIDEFCRFITKIQSHIPNPETEMPAQTFLGYGYAAISMLFFSDPAVDREKEIRKINIYLKDSLDRFEKIRLSQVENLKNLLEANPVSELAEQWRAEFFKPKPPAVVPAPAPEEKKEVNLYPVVP